MPSHSLSWRRFFLHRLLRLAVLLPLVAFTAFVLVSVSPIDPVRALVKTEVMRVGVEQQAAIAHKWGLDEPPSVRFGKWLANAAQGDLGRSMIYDDEVARVIGKRFLASLSLMAVAWSLSGAIGFTLGVIAGALEGSIWDRLIRTYAFTLASAPTFWIAILMLLYFAVHLGWAPYCCAAPPGMLPDEVSLLQRLHHLVLPSLTLSLLGVAQVTLHTRDKVREVMASEYALLAFAQGASRLRVAHRHALRNGAIPALTLQFAHLGELFGGSILAETVFAYPGLGQATVEAGTRGDAPLLLGIALFAAVFVFAGNTLADALTRWLDPRQSRPRQTDSDTTPDFVH